MSCLGTRAVCVLNQIQIYSAPACNRITTSACKGSLPTVGCCLILKKIGHHEPSAANDAVTIISFFMVNWIMSHLLEHDPFRSARQTKQENRFMHGRHSNQACAVSNALPRLQHAAKQLFVLLRLLIHNNSLLAFLSK